MGYEGLQNRHKSLKAHISYSTCGSCIV